MSLSIAKEKRLLTEAEFDAVLASHHPHVAELGDAELAHCVRLIRQYRDKARTVADQQRRELRGKAEARGTRPARDDTGTRRKASVFASALKRLNHEMARRQKATRRESQAEIAQRALALKRAARPNRRPGAGRSSGEGMHPVTSDRRPVIADPREIGRVSQFVKNAQARRDG